MIANLDPVAAKSAAPTYQLRIVLLGAEPSIWRTLQVPGRANLGWLHAVLQTAMGWTNRAFGPKSFDQAKVNSWLGKLKWPRVTEVQLRKVLMGRDNYTPSP